MIVLTPDGKISRYIFGATFDARELRNALVAAREGESTSTLSKLFLLCYHYNPITGKFGALIMSIVRVAGVVTLLVITGFVALMVGRDRRARRALYETELLRRTARRSVRTNNDSRWTNPSFPAASFDDVPEVDALFFTLIAVSLFFLAIIFLPIIFFPLNTGADRRPTVPIQAPDHFYSRAAGQLARSFWDLDCFRGRAHLFPDRAPPGQRNRRAGGRQTMDVEAAARRGQTRDQRAHVPVNRTVVLTMTSQDVIHSFFVPAFRVKQDVVPGRYHQRVVQGHQAR